jgi:hypothetical protein
VFRFANGVEKRFEVDPDAATLELAPAAAAQRTSSKRITLQQGLSSIVGIYMVTSGGRQWTTPSQRAVSSRFEPGRLS